MIQDMGDLKAWRTERMQIYWSVKLQISFMPKKMSNYSKKTAQVPVSAIPTTTWNIALALGALADDLFKTLLPLEQWPR